VHEVVDLGRIELPVEQLTNYERLVHPTWLETLTRGRSAWHGLSHSLGRLYTAGDQRGRGPVLVCLDSDTGKLIWEKRLDAWSAGSRHHHAEDEAVHQKQQQRVDERPEKAQHRAPIAGLEFARDEAGDERSVPGEPAETGEHVTSRRKA